MVACKDRSMGGVHLGLSLGREELVPTGGVLSEVFTDLDDVVQQPVHVLLRSQLVADDPTRNRLLKLALKLRLPLHLLELLGSPQLHCARQAILAVDGLRPGILRGHLGDRNSFIVSKHLLVTEILLRQHGRRRLSNLNVGSVARLITSVHDVAHHVSQLVCVAPVHVRDDLLRREYHVPLVLSVDAVWQVDHFVPAEGPVAEACGRRAERREVLLL
mmetsp:Transcript_50509/g.157716  ORF Transcript_50509/g.157716 Transcript_50509/m.157716 type:complete len:217 (+) Transcript_50509:331-981(+)